MIKAFDLWLPAYLRRPRSSTPSRDQTHLIVSICDHFEPFHDAGKPEAIERVQNWQREYPTLEFEDSDGASPRHTFFYPIEQYDPEILSRLSDLCHASPCETEIHLHHDGDNAANLRRTLEEGKGHFRHHGLLSTDAQGALRYGFIHGNWALAHSHPKGKHCGVPDELAVLSETGCYADFTMPSAPSPTQTRTINSIYYAKGDGRPKPHDKGIHANTDRPNQEGLLMVQGPLGLNWRWRKFGVLPRVENGDLTAANPPTLARLLLWLDLHIHVHGRPEWIFVKLHSHGALPRNSGMLLGEPMKHFHRELNRFAVETGIHFHYASAREMVNMIHAAEAGLPGGPGEYRDFRYRRIS